MIMNNNHVYASEREGERGGEREKRERVIERDGESERE